MGHCKQLKKGFLVCVPYKVTLMEQNTYFANFIMIKIMIVHKMRDGIIEIKNPRNNPILITVILSKVVYVHLAIIGKFDLFKCKT